jgi:hypothetical protein
MDSSEIHENTLADFFKAMAEAKKQPKEIIEEKAPEPQITFEDFFKAVIEEKTGSIQSPAIKEATKVSMESIAEEILKENIAINLHEQPLGLFGGNASVKIQDPLTPLNQNFVTMEDLQKHYKTFIQRVQQQLSTIGGGGETRLRKLTDVNSKTLSDGRYLKYDEASGKFIFDNIKTNNTVLVNTPNYSILDTDYYIGINYNGAVNIILPITSEDGKQLIIKDESGNCSVNPISVIGNVDNDLNGFILQIDNGSIQLIYRAGWRII